MDKPILFYQVRPQTNRADGSVVFVPSIVDRDPSVPLDEIINHALDRGLIAGLKASSVDSVAKGLCQQMYEEFKSGNGVKFDDYFYAKLYLDGTSDNDGKLTSANGINVRFVAGTKFKLDRSMFSFSNVQGGDIPGVDFLVSDAQGAVRGELIPSQPIMLNGVNLYKDGDVGTKVSFYRIVDGEVTGDLVAEVTAFTSRGENLLKFAWPSALNPGYTYQAIPSRTADGSRWFTGAGKSCSVTENA